MILRESARAEERSDLNAADGREEAGTVGGTVACGDFILRRPLATFAESTRIHYSAKRRSRYRA
jgi:hypothetical protein